MIQCGEVVRAGFEPGAFPARTDGHRRWDNTHERGESGWQEELLSLLPKWDFSRREFVMTSLAAGFALAVQPVSAETITTDTKGIEAGEVKIPVVDGEIPGYRGDARIGGTVSDGARGPRNLRRARAHQGHLPAIRQARLFCGCTGALCAARGRLEIDEHSGNPADRHESSGRTSAVRFGFHGRVGQEGGQSGYSEAGDHRLLLGWADCLAVLGA